MPPKKAKDTKDKRKVKVKRKIGTRGGVVVNVSVVGQKRSVAPRAVAPKMPSDLSAMRGQMMMANRPSPYATFTPLANLDQSIATIRAQANNQLMRTEREILERAKTMGEQMLTLQTQRGSMMPTPAELGLISRGEMSVQTVETGTEPRKGGRPRKAEERLLSGEAGLAEEEGIGMTPSPAFTKGRRKQKKSQEKAERAMGLGYSTPMFSSVSSETIGEA